MLDRVANDREALRTAILHWLDPWLGVLAGTVTPVVANMIMALMTALIALIPFGTPFVWGYAAVWLLLTGHTAAGIGLLVCGGATCSPAQRPRVRGPFRADEPFAP